MKTKYNRDDGTAFTDMFPHTPVTNPIQLRGIAHVQGHPGYANNIQGMLREGIARSPEVRELIAIWHDNLKKEGQPCTSENAFEVFLASIDVQATFDEKTRKTKWSRQHVSSYHAARGENKDESSARLSFDPSSCPVYWSPAALDTCNSNSSASSSRKLWGFIHQKIQPLRALACFCSNWLASDMLSSA
ncbi:hypothetical protein DFP72DRAFT_1060132 [Ephemerocybe angulata]|uniref:Uncharacterized protein n=1 Tax=Ephemerocybe angulata TaxID=980116 RepID=A0A8H6IFL6_9AGAR|nr:hypothetical protein DFP72DRAFT_1060132 [Tulosesus angulatus]